MAMKIGILICTSDRNTCFMAIRYAAFHLVEHTDVNMYLVDSGLRYDRDDDKTCNLRKLMTDFKQSGGKVYRIKDRDLLMKRLLKQFDGMISSRQIGSICHNDTFQSVIMRNVYIRKFI